MRKLAITLICAAAMNAAAQMSESTPVSIQVDLAKSQGPYTPIYSWFGYDESNYTTMKYGKQLLRELTRPESGTGVHPRSSLVDIGQWGGRVEVEFIERIHARREWQAGIRLHHYRSDF